MIGLKGVFLVTTVAEVTGLWPAIIADTGATVLVSGWALNRYRHVTPAAGANPPAQAAAEVDGGELD